MHSGIQNEVTFDGSAHVLGSIRSLAYISERC